MGSEAAEVLRRFFPRSLADAAGCGILALGLFLGLFAWGFSSPYGTTLDEDYHTISAWCPQPGSSQCPIAGENAKGEPVIKVPSEFMSRMCFYAKIDASGACALKANKDGLVETSRVNDGAYPGYYYTIMHLLSSDDINAMALKMRMVNAMIAALMSFALMLFLTAPGRRIFAWALAATAVPMMPHLVASAAPDSWSLTGVTTAAVAVTGALLTNVRWRQLALGALALAGTLLAAAARSDAAAFAMLAVMLAGLVRWRRLARRGQWPLWAAMLLVLAVGAWGFLSGSQGSAVSTGLGDAYHNSIPISPLRLALANLIYLPEWLANVWWRGLFDMGGSLMAGFVLFAAGAVVVWSGIFRSHLSRAKALALVLAAGTFLGLPLIVVQNTGYLISSGHTGLQPRYLLPLLVIVTVLALTPVPGQSGAVLPLRVTVWLWVAVAAAQAVNLHYWIRRWVTGMNVTGLDLDTHAQWWRSHGPSPLGTWVLGSLGFAVAAFAVIAVQRNHRHQPGG